MTKSSSMRQYLINYIALKINSGEWSISTKIPSENVLAKKFECSRLTVRNALQQFVYMGYLDAERGRGYRVNAGFDSVFIKPLGKIVGADAKRVFVPENTFYPDEKLLKKIDSRCGSFFKKKFFYFEKQYFKKNDLIVHQISYLNIARVRNVDLNQVQESLISFLAYSGIIVKDFSETIFFISKDSQLFDVAEKLGWDGDFPVLLTTSFDKNGWIEISFKIFAKQNFSIVFTKRFV